MPGWTGHVPRTQRKSRRFGRSLQSSKGFTNFHLNQAGGYWVRGMSKGVEQRVTHICMTASGMRTTAISKATRSSRRTVLRHWDHFCNTASFTAGVSGRTFDDMQNTIMGPENRARLVMDVYARPSATCRERAELMWVRYGVRVSDETVRLALETVTLALPIVPALTCYPGRRPLLPRR